MGSKSGSNQVLLLAALKYLRLISENGLPTPDLEKVTSVQGPERQRAWRAIILKAYDELLQPNIDIERTTTQELSEAFVRQGVSSPDTVKKCVTFFSLAAKDAGLKLSPHVKPYAGRRRVVAGRNGARNDLRLDERTHNIATISESLLRKFPSFDPSWPEEERKNWLAAFEQLTKSVLPPTSSKANEVINTKKASTT
jgi:hypothetical protein